MHSGQTRIVHTNDRVPSPAGIHLPCPSRSPACLLCGRTRRRLCKEAATSFTPLPALLRYLVSSPVQYGSKLLNPGRERMLPQRSS